MDSQFPTIPGYQIEGEIARGGMGVVYRARHLALERTVALKVIHPKFAGDPEFVQSFEKEARIVARLSHPNIVSVYDFGCHEGTYYLSMQYVNGTPVRELLLQRRPSFEEMVDIVRQVADALDYAHREQVIHRDVKTGNILLCPGGKVMVIDFGIAHGDYSASANSIWLGAGTRSYLSPEQCKGQPATARSDQYSLGIAVYEMLTGHLPFPATDPLAVMKQHVAEIPPPLRRGRTDITPRMEAAVLRALSKVPEMRFGSVGAFAKELEAACREASDAEQRIASAAPSTSPTPLISATAIPVSSPLTGGMPASVPRPTSQRTGYLNATRGGGARRGLSAFAWVLIAIVLAGAGGLGYYVWAQNAAGSKRVAAAAKPAPKKKPQKTRNGRRRSSISSSGRSAEISLSAPGVPDAAPPAKSGEESTPTDSDQAKDEPPAEPEPTPDSPPDKDHTDEESPKSGDHSEG